MFNFLYESISGVEFEEGTNNATINRRRQSWIDRLTKYSPMKLSHASSFYGLFDSISCLHMQFIASRFICAQPFGFQPLDTRQIIGKFVEGKIEHRDYIERSVVLLITRLPSRVGKHALFSYLLHRPLSVDHPLIRNSFTSDNCWQKTQYFTFKCTCFDCCFWNEITERRNSTKNICCALARISHPSSFVEMCKIFCESSLEGGNVAGVCSLSTVSGRSLDYRDDFSLSWPDEARWSTQNATKKVNFLSPVVVVTVENEIVEENLTQKIILKVFIWKLN